MFLLAWHLVLALARTNFGKYQLIDMMARSIDIIEYPIGSSFP